MSNKINYYKLQLRDIENKIKAIIAYEDIVFDANILGNNIKLMRLNNMKSYENYGFGVTPYLSIFLI